MYLAIHQRKINAKENPSHMWNEILLLKTYITHELQCRYILYSFS